MKENGISKMNSEFNLQEYLVEFAEFRKFATFCSQSITERHSVKEVSFSKDSLLLPLQII